MTVTETAGPQAAEVARRPTRPARQRPPAGRRFAPYWFIAPFFVVFAAFGVYPMLFALQLSFTNWQGAGTAEWIGFANYTYLLQSTEFWSSLADSSVMWLLVVPVQALLGLVVAVILNSAKLRLKGMYRAAFVVPFVTPLVAMAQIWIVAFDREYGPVNALLNLFGLPDVGWLTTTTWSKPTLALLFLWKTTGFAVIILLSGLQSVSSTVYEAADIDGCSAVRKFWHITVPLVRRTLAFLVVIQTLAVFQMFAEPYVVTKGGPYNSTTTAGYFLYNHIGISDLGTGAANSFLLVIVVMALSLLSVRLLRPKDE
jgi:ABC-type sugar transport system permease subunit